MKNKYHTQENISSTQTDTMTPKMGFHVYSTYSTGDDGNNGASSFTMDSSYFAKAKANKAMLDSEMLLSKASHSASSSEEGGRNQHQPFHAIFDRELIRVVNFIDLQQQNLEFSGKSLLTSAEVAAETKNSQGEEGAGLVHSLSQKMEDYVESCIELQNFMNENRAIFRSVAEKADKELQTTCSSFVEGRFKANLNSVLVIVASDIYAAIRTAEKKLRNNGAAAGNPQNEMWQAPSSFQRSTTKYWVKDDQLTKLLLTCAAEAPLLVYGKKGTLTSKKNRLSRESEGDKLWETLATPITSVYFDSADMSLYNKRLARAEGAQLLRARWYGNNMPKGNGIIFLELKTHHEKWVSNKSVKERAAVRECDMPAFLKPMPWTIKDAQAMILRASPTLAANELQESANLLFRMHRLVVKHNLKACVRSVYMRAAFQSPKSNGKKICARWLVISCTLNIPGFSHRALRFSSRDWNKSLSLRFAPDSRSQCDLD